MSLSIEDFNTLVESMDIIRSQEQILNIEATAYTSLMDKARKDIISKHEKNANRLVEKKVLSTEDLFKMLQG